MSDPNQHANEDCSSQSKARRGGEEEATQADRTNRRGDDDEANKGRRMNAKRNPWLWVPSIYIAEGIPYMIVMTVSVVMYKNLGLSNTDIALYTSWLYLP